MHHTHGLRRASRAVAGAAVLVLAAGGVAAAGGQPGAAPVASASTVATAGPPEDRTDPRTATAELTIPAIGVTDLPVVPYEGTTDDAPGTRVQDRGVAASPYGVDGGVGPGEVGNYLVTAHRLSAGGPLHDLPALHKGDKVLVEEGGTVYEYRITESRMTSFRSAHSLAEQRAEVPGKPGEKPTRAMITLSTCATPEDDAAGNFWRDAQHNPEHRIDKIGVLVSSRPS
ncbi:class E sortase [Streptomyces sp. NBC_00178]|uniref:class E sortase n=1 Tax=Streptomyces sp. NBC_00178 TaxID=2975672 RepID=UPI002E28CC89|nr:class E sortase [Streptomyces sp. NBC_00178]